MEKLVQNIPIGYVKDDHFRIRLAFQKIMILQSDRMLRKRMIWRADHKLVRDFSNYYRPENFRNEYINRVF